MKKILEYILIFILTLSTLAFISACSKDDSPTEPENNGGSNEYSNPSGQPTPNFASDPNYGGLMATINYEFQTLPGFPPANLALAFAQFGEGTDGGDVVVNQNTLGKNQIEGRAFYLVPSLSNPTQVLSNVNFNGSAHSWTVAGVNEISSINGSVSSARTFSLTSPANDAVITASNGINITWNGGTSSRVLVVLASTSGGNNYVAFEDLDDDGSHTIAANELGEIHGGALLQVVKYNYSSVNAGGKNYYIISEVVRSASITLN